LSEVSQTANQIASQTGGNPSELRKQLKGMVRKGLISAGEAEGGLGFKLMPFVVGFYEMQNANMDEEMAALFEQYFLTAFGMTGDIKPSVHRVIPVHESIQPGLAVRPYESVLDIVSSCQAWGVIDCICRKQKALIGDSCRHPVDNCMVMSSIEGVFDKSNDVKALTKDEAISTLRKAAEAGLVHSVSNYQKELWYICNCCTCSCGVLRGMAELGLASVVAGSGFVNQVDHELCILCSDCLDRCPFGALTIDDRLIIDELRCAGCGVCVIACPSDALKLVERPPQQVTIPPMDQAEWMRIRAASRNHN
jgi:NAD-dependent dihydropyrimidine dehydrogenase PreA subunit